MKNIIFLTISSILFTSCASTKSSIFYGGMSGAAVGGGIGYSLSPDKESDVFNTAVWGAVGAVIGAGVGYLLNADDPDNQEMKQMIRPENQFKEEIKPLDDDFGFKLIKANESKSYVVPDQNLPDRLKGKIKKQVLTEHIVKEREEKAKDGSSTFVYPEIKVIEYSYE